MARLAEHSDTESVKEKSEPPAEQNGGGAVEEVEEGDGSEYEIEQVLDAKRGVFPDGRMGYFVKWKGYGPNENSWVDEQDAINATELVDEYWRKANQAKKARKSLDKARKSLTVDNGPEESRPKKRGRKPLVDTSKSDSEMEVDPPQPQAKKPRKSQTKKSSQTEIAEEPILASMATYMHLDDWEALVSSVDTVERESDNSLSVYFTLNSGECVMESSNLCNKRFPQTLLRFYESNLKWRTVEELD